MHEYTSTACLHNMHKECRLTCKFCKAKCLCDCHRPTPRKHHLLPSWYTPTRKEQAHLDLFFNPAYIWDGDAYHQAAREIRNKALASKDAPQ